MDQEDGDELKRAQTERQATGYICTANSLITLYP